MVKIRKKSGRFKQKEEYDSDDERAYKDLGEPDQKSREYIYDDIDEFHAGEEKIMLEAGEKIPTADSSDDQEEIFPMDISDDDDDKLKEKDSDSEEEDYVELDTTSWGKKKSSFYGTDYVGDDYGGFEGSNAEEAEAEEEEARAIEKRLREQLDENDFVLDTFEMEKKPLEEDIKVEINVDQLSKREKMKLLKKKYPELLLLIEELKSKLAAVRDLYQPLKTLIDDGTILPEKASQYILVKHTLYLHYCINISFYLVLVTHGTRTDTHPVMKRLATFKSLINQLEPVDKELEEDLVKFLEHSRSGARLTVTENTMPINKKKDKAKKIVKKLKSIKDEKTDKLIKDKKKTDEFIKDKKKTNKLADVKTNKIVRFETEDEKLALQQYDMMKAGRRIKHQPEEMEEEEEEEEDEQSPNLQDMVDNSEEGEKRHINYQIAKNKGLTPRRKKEYRNPRVKHRIKYRKARIRRKGQIREPRTELQRYGGELSGIRTSVKKSIKIK